MRPVEDVSFMTLDGLTLQGHLYVAAERGPGVIMNPGFAGVKEFLTNVAESFQKVGITVLAFDPRGFGASDGEPRQEVRPPKQVEDYIDAVTFLAAHAAVDAQQIALWGVSYSAIIALNAAALDRRVACVLAACPMADWSDDARVQLLRERALARAMRERVAQLTAGVAPFTLPIAAPGGANPFGAPAFELDADAPRWAALAERRGSRFRNCMTLQTYVHTANWDGFALLRYVAPTPVLVLVGGEDKLSPPARVRRLVDERLGEPRRLHVEPGVGHMDLLSGEHGQRLIRMQVEFVRQHHKRPAV